MPVIDLRAVGVSTLVLVLTWPGLMRAAPDEQMVPLVMQAGRPLAVALDERVTIKRVGQPITGTVIEPVYAYDRVVVPAGTKVLGHVAQLEGPSKLSRIRSILSGDLTPDRHVVLRFNTLMLATGEVPIQTIVTGEIAHLTRTAAAAPAGKTPESGQGGSVARAGEEVKNRATDAIDAAKQKAHDTLSALTQPGKMARLRDAMIQRLPYHPQFLSKGLVFQAELVTPVDFGMAAGSDLALPGTRPAPSSLLNARLTTTLDSSKTPRGTPIEAVVTDPVFSADHGLIFPEGTRLKGEVTFSKPARRFHRNGQLRFLIETVQAQGAEEAPSESPLLASLEAVQASADDHVVIDEEGGATLSSPKTRFIAPALAVLALRANTGRHGADHDGDANDVPGATVQSGNVATRGLGGFLGLGVLGIGLSQISRPIGIALSLIGAGRTVYSNILGKGQDLRFPVDTAIQLQLAPGPTGQP